MNGKVKTVVGLDIGGTKCAVLLGAYDGQTISILRRESILTDNQQSPYIILEKLMILID